MAAQVQAGADTPEPNKAEIERLQALYRSIDWQVGPCDAQLGTIAEIKVPQGLPIYGQRWRARSGPN